MATKRKARAERTGEIRRRAPKQPDGGTPRKKRGVTRFADPMELAEAVRGWARETIVAGLGPPPPAPSDPPGFEGMFGNPADLTVSARLADFEAWLAELMETAKANPYERQLDEEARKVTTQLADAIRAALIWANAPPVAYWKSSARLALAEVLDDPAWAVYLARLGAPLVGISAWSELRFLVQTLASPLDGKITRRSPSRKEPMTLDELTAAIILAGKTGTAEASEAIRIQNDQGRSGATVREGVDATRKRVRQVLRRSIVKGRKPTPKD
jgi:hypothetical protein